MNLSFAVKQLNYTARTDVHTALSCWKIIVMRDVFDISPVRWDRLIRYLEVGGEF